MQRNRQGAHKCKRGGRFNREYANELRHPERYSSLLVQPDHRHGCRPAWQQLGRYVGWHHLQ